MEQQSAARGRKRQVAKFIKDHRVRFFNAVDLANQLEQEKLQGKAGNMARQLVQADGVILDELGYLPFPASGGALLCGIRNPRPLAPPHCRLDRPPALQGWSVRTWEHIEPERAFSNILDTPRLESLLPRSRMTPAAELTHDHGS